MINARFDKDKKNKLSKQIFYFCRSIRRKFSCKVSVTDGKNNFVFAPEDSREFKRYLSMFTKEEGTIKWLDETIKPNDVFIDIGANIGLYTVYAAKLDSSVKVYAFEPHKLNYATLLENISLNNMEQQISPVGVPLNDSNAILKFNYDSMEKGSSASQLGHNKKVDDNSVFTPKLEEIVYAVTLDNLVEAGEMPTPTVIKIDVDGNEMQVLGGMKNILASDKKPRSIQVEANIGQKPLLVDYLGKFDYKIDHSHYTEGGLNKLDEGINEDQIAHNIVFTIQPA